MGVGLDDVNERRRRRTPSSLALGYHQRQCERRRALPPVTSLYTLVGKLIWMRAADAARQFSRPAAKAAVAGLLTRRGHFRRLVKIV